MNDIKQSDAGSIIDATRASTQAYVLQLENGEELVAIPGKGTAETRVISSKSLTDPFEADPRFFERTQQVIDAASFIAHYLKFRTDETILIAETGEKPRVEAIYNYHSTDGPRRCDWRCRLSLKLSDEWKRWDAIAGKQMLQADFAQFLEDCALDVLEPTADAAKAKIDEVGRAFGSFAGPAKLLELKDGLEIRVNQQVANKVKLLSGETKLVFSEEHTGAGGEPLNVPSAFVIAIPVFERAAGYVVPVRLRCRVTSGRVAWSLEPFGMQRVFDHAFEEVLSQVRVATGVPVLIGTP